MAMRTGSRLRPKDRAAAVERIFNGQSTVEDEARRYRVSPRAVRGWVAGVKTTQSWAKIIGTATPKTPAATSSPATAQAPASAAAPEPAPLDPAGLERAAAALRGEPAPTPEGQSSEEAAPAPPPPASPADEEDALAMMADAKEELLVTYCELRFGPQCDPRHPELRRAIEPGALLRRATRKNAGVVAPVADFLVGNPIGLVCVFALDMLRSIAQAKRAALEAGWIAPAEEPDQATEPPVTADAPAVEGQEKPPPAPPAPAEGSVEEGKGSIRMVDAPPFLPQDGATS
jgi:transposase-like protein